MLQIYRFRTGKSAYGLEQPMELVALWGVVDLVTGQRGRRVRVFLGAFLLPTLGFRCLWHQLGLTSLGKWLVCSKFLAFLKINRLQDIEHSFLVSQWHASLQLTCCK